VVLLSIQVFSHVMPRRLQNNYRRLERSQCNGLLVEAIMSKAMNFIFARQSCFYFKIYKISCFSKYINARRLRTLNFLKLQSLPPRKFAFPSC
jgi:hypothetical protein